MAAAEPEIVLAELLLVEFNAWAYSLLILYDRIYIYDIFLADFGALCLAVVAATVLILTTPVGSTAVSLTSETSQSRWVYPCSGGMVVEGVGNSVSGLTFEEQGGAAAVDMVDSVDWYSTLHILAQVTTRLKRMVQDLKTLYVSRHR